MCKLLKISRSLVYYHLNKRSKTRTVSEEDVEIENSIIRIFRESRNNYGTRKIRKELRKEGKKVSRRKISQIMIKYSLISNYTVLQYKVHKKGYNQEEVPNTVNREFEGRKILEVVVSDLTYVRVNNKWAYICILLDLHNREVIGYSAGFKKDANLVYQALLSCKYPLSDIEVFHSDRGNEFKNRIIDEVIKVFNIKRSLSNKGCPYDNAVVESFYNIIKTEFIKQKVFLSMSTLKLELADYVNWYNNHRIHGSLNYMSPIEYKKGLESGYVENKGMNEFVAT